MKKTTAAEIAADELKVDKLKRAYPDLNDLEEMYKEQLALLTRCGPEVQKRKTELDAEYFRRGNLYQQLIAYEGMDFAEEEQKKLRTEMREAPRHRFENLKKRFYASCEEWASARELWIRLCNEAPQPPKTAE